MAEFEGYCVCDEGVPARDCGVSAHRREAFLASLTPITTDDLIAIAKRTVEPQLKAALASR